MAAPRIPPRIPNILDIIEKYSTISDQSAVTRALNIAEICDRIVSCVANSLRPPPLADGSYPDGNTRDASNLETGPVARRRIQLANTRDAVNLSLVCKEFRERVLYDIAPYYHVRLTMGVSPSRTPAGTWKWLVYRCDALIKYNGWVDMSAQKLSSDLLDIIVKDQSIPVKREKALTLLGPANSAFGALVLSQAASLKADTGRISASARELFDRMSTITYLPLILLDCITKFTLDVEPYELLARGASLDVLDTPFQVRDDQPEMTFLQLFREVLNRLCTHSLRELVVTGFNRDVVEMLLPLPSTTYANAQFRALILPVTSLTISDTLGETIRGFGGIATLTITRKDPRGPNCFWLRDQQNMRKDTVTSFTHTCSNWDESLMIDVTRVFPNLKHLRAKGKTSKFDRPGNIEWLRLLDPLSGHQGISQGLVTLEVPRSAEHVMGVALDSVDGKCTEKLARWAASHFLDRFSFPAIETFWYLGRKMTFDPVTGDMVGDFNGVERSLSSPRWEYEEVLSLWTAMNACSPDPDPTITGVWGPYD